MVGSVIGAIRRRWLIAVLLASATVNVALAMRVHELTIGVVPPLALPIGTSLGPIDGTDANGKAVSIRFEDSALPTLIYLVRPGCGWCHRNIENMKALVAQAAGRYRFITLFVGSIATNEFDVPEPFALANPLTLQTYKLGGTPHTLLVSQRGVVLNNWPGAYSTTQQREIQRRLGVTLPGLVKQ